MTPMTDDDVKAFKQFCGMIGVKLTPIQEMVLRSKPFYTGDTINFPNLLKGTTE